MTVLVRMACCTAPAGRMSMAASWRSCQGRLALRNSLSLFCAPPPPSLQAGGEHQPGGSDGGLQSRDAGHAQDGAGGGDVCRYRHSGGAGPGMAAEGEWRLGLVGSSRRRGGCLAVRLAWHGRRVACLWQQPIVVGHVLRHRHAAHVSAPQQLQAICWPGVPQFQGATRFKAMHAVFDDPAAMEGAQDPEVRVWDGRMVATP